MFENLANLAGVPSIVYGILDSSLLLRAVASVVNKLPNRVTITGHTSATPGSRSDADWPLSAARADAARQILQASGVDADRVYQVSGKSHSEPLYPDDPTLPGNRRIAIALGVFGEQLVRQQGSVRLPRDDVGERAATVDPELPHGVALVGMSKAHQGRVGGGDASPGFPTRFQVRRLQMADVSLTVTSCGKPHHRAG